MICNNSQVGSESSQSLDSLLKHMVDSLRIEIIIEGDCSHMMPGFVCDINERCLHYSKLFKRLELVVGHLQS